MTYLPLIVIGFELFFAWVCWQWASDCFEDDRVAVGYWWIFVSAFNFAAAMSAIF